jgi:hypothetical protein
MYTNDRRPEPAETLRHLTIRLSLIEELVCQQCMQLHPVVKRRNDVIVAHRF